jgi:hypothetical protein
MMQNHQPFMLYRTDGSTVQVRNYYQSPTDRLANHLVSDDGRVIYCQDEQRGIFWYKDTQEKLYLNNPA